MAAEKIERYVAGRRPAYLTKGEIEELITFDYGEEFWEDPQGWLARAQQACESRRSVRFEPEDLHVRWLN